MATVELTKDEAEQLLYALAHCKNGLVFDLFNRLESVFFPEGWDDSKYNYSQSVELDLENMFLEAL
jgi:hypothetical protein